MSLFSETVTLVSRGGVTGQDEYGNDMYGPVVRTDYPAWLEQRNGTEDTNAREQSVANMWLFLPLDAPLESVDAVEWDGRTWEVDGEPGRQPGGFEVEGYQVAALRRVTG